MKMKELRALPKTDLAAKQQELRKEILKTNAQIALGAGIQNPGKVRTIKKTLARINALLAADPQNTAGQHGKRGGRAKQ